MNKINATRFMSQRELAAQLTELDLNHMEECTRGGIPLLVKDGKVYVDAEDHHTLIFGSTGSKKTRFFGMPAVKILSSAGESFLVTDPKGEIYERTAAETAARGYQVLCLNLRDFHNGVTWNPLLLPYDCYHSGNRGKAVEMVSELAAMIIGENMQDPFWSNTAADVLVGLMLVLLESAEREECNVKSIFSLWDQYLDNREEMLSGLRKRYGDTMIMRRFRSLENSSEKTVGSIESVVAGGLNRLDANEEFVEFLSQEGLEFAQVVRQKTAIYLVIPDENTYYHFIASIFMEQMYEALIAAAQEQPDCRLPIRMNYIVDEFANMPKMRNMASMITAARSRNIRFHLIIQSRVQLDEKYGAGAEVICDNCVNWVYLHSRDYKLLHTISELCGDVVYDNHMVLPLVSEFELQHLKKEEGEALVLAGRSLPCIVNLEDIDAYPDGEGEESSRKTVTKQKWLPVSVYHMKKSRSKSTCQYLPTREQMERQQMKRGMSRDTWLVGACNGVILIEDMADGKRVDSGAEIFRLCFAELADIEDAVELTWYKAPGTMRQHYYTLLCAGKPENACVTIQEIGEKCFTPVKINLAEKLKGAGIC